MKGAAAAAAIASAWWLGSPGTVEGSPVFGMRMQALNATLGESSYSPTLLHYGVGDTINYQVVGALAPVGTVWSGSGGFTITSLTTGPDGSNAVRLDLFQTISQSAQVNFGPGAALQNGWNASPDNSPGTLVARGNGNNDISAIRPGRAPGNFSAIQEQVILTGTFTVTADTLADSLVQLRWSTGAGSLHVNGSGLAKFPSLLTETGQTPFIGFTPLTLRHNSAPITNTNWNGDTNGTWSGGPWSNGAPFSTGSGPYNATLGSIITAPRTITLSSPGSVAALTINSPFSYTVAGSALTFTEVTQTMVTVASPALYVNGGNHAFSGTTNLGGTTTLAMPLYVSGNATVTFAGATNQVATVTKEGVGTAVVGSYSLPLNSTLQINMGTVRAISGAGTSFSGIGAIVVGANGDLDLNGTQANIGTITATGPIRLGSGTLSAVSGTISGRIDGAGGGITVGGGTGTLTLSGSNSYTGATQMNAGGTLTAAAPNALLGTSQLVLNGGTFKTTSGIALVKSVITTGAATGTFDLTGSNSVTDISGTAGVTKVGSGTLMTQWVRVDGPLTVNAGTFQIMSQLANVVPDVPTVAPGAKFDINSGKMIVQFGTGPSQVLQARASIVAGRGGTDFGNVTWNGTGGIASHAASTSNGGDGVSFAVGYVENSFLPLIGLPSYTSFGGQTVDQFSLLIRYTRGADVNLDGVINTADVTVVGADYNMAGSDQWYYGDFDYDGIVDSDDVTTLGALYDSTAPPLSYAQLLAQYGYEFAEAFERGRTSGIPEPAAIGPLLTFALAGLRRRRGKSRG